jgi:hypothetical protein
MRNNMTDTLGKQLTVAWINSNMGLQEFISYCDTHRESVVWTTEDTMHVMLEGSDGECTLITCYFAEQRWWCKA